MEVTNKINMPAGEYAGLDGHKFVGSKGSVAYESDGFYAYSIKEFEDSWWRSLGNSGPRTVPELPKINEVTFI